MSLSIRPLFAHYMQQYLRLSLDVRELSHNNEVSFRLTIFMFLFACYYLLLLFNSQVIAYQVRGFFSFFILYIYFALCYNQAWAWYNTLINSIRFFIYSIFFSFFCCFDDDSRMCLILSDVSVCVPRESIIILYTIYFVFAIASHCIDLHSSQIGPGVLCVPFRDLFTFMLFTSFIQCSVHIHFLMQDNEIDPIVNTQHPMQMKQ